MSCDQTVELAIMAFGNKTKSVGVLSNAWTKIPYSIAFEL